MSWYSVEYTSHPPHQRPDVSLEADPDHAGVERQAADMLRTLNRIFRKLG
jgi:hypothetical protein